MFFRVFNVIALLVIMFGMVCSTPTIDGRNQAPIPQLRVTCDLLSFQFAGFSSGDSFCAAHCLYLGYRGGFCNGQKIFYNYIHIESLEQMNSYDSYYSGQYPPVVIITGSAPLDLKAASIAIAFHLSNGYEIRSSSLDRTTFLYTLVNPHFLFMTPIEYSRKLEQTSKSSNFHIATT
ncbi:hypothetical protein I4U23_023235 [Adineta vaga]|nr:hypothetical protein I4U23_023235 [Adineta vaga]